MLRGRIVSANGVTAEDLKPSPQAAWALQSDRGITYSADIPTGSRVVEANGGRPTIRARRCSRWRSGSPTGSA